MSEATLLVADDEEAQRKTLTGYLKKQGYIIHAANSGREGMEILRRNPVDLVLTDIRMPEMGGLDFLFAIKEINPEIGVVVMTAFGNVDDAVTAMKQGAEDYLQKPIDLDHLDIVVKKVLERKQLVSENRELKEILQTKYNFRQLISGSGQMEEVLNLAARAAKSRATVLLRGESGTGKEVLARAIHFASSRKDKPIVAVNVAAITENLVESEFFGHEKGAFTGADQQRTGRFEMADKGTLFIDEVGDIPVSIQVKLLRVLQERAFERVGGGETIHVDVRVIAATNQDLEALIRDGRFREDLYYRLNVIIIQIPPLRARKEEIPLFIDHFLRKYRDEENKNVRSVSKETLDVLMKYPYPGNVRELENIIQRAVVLTREDTISTKDLPPHIKLPEEKRSQSGSGSMTEQVEALEKVMIRDALKVSQGNQSEAARSLGITERNLRYKLKKYGLKTSTI